MPRSFQGPDTLTIFSRPLDEVRVEIAQVMMPVPDGVSVISNAVDVEHQTTKELKSLQVGHGLTTPYSKRDLLAWWRWRLVRYEQISARSHCR